MGTTSLIVEMVIIGFQVVVWMVLILLSIFGYEWIDLLKLKDWTTFISVVVVGTSYTLGIVFDSFTGSLFAPWERRSSRWLPERVNESPGLMRAYIMAANPDASEELNNRANRNSLIRATSLNLILISITSLVFVHTRIGFSLKLESVIAVFSAILLMLAISSWGKLRNGYYFYLNQVYQATKELEEKESHSDSASSIKPTAA